MRYAAVQRHHRWAGACPAGRLGTVARIRTRENRLALPRRRPLGLGRRVWRQPSNASKVSSGLTSADLCPDLDCKKLQ